MLTLIAHLDVVPMNAFGAPAGYRLRDCQRSDVSALGALYFKAYDAGEACATLQEAVADIAATFAGEYGTLIPAASPVMLHGERIVAAALTVRRAPWDNTPDCPFIVKVFTARNHRRRGLARCALRHIMAALGGLGESSVALRVDSANAVAMELYMALEFTEWDPRESDLVEVANEGVGAE